MRYLIVIMVIICLVILAGCQFKSSCGVELYSDKKDKGTEVVCDYNSEITLPVGFGFGKVEH